MEDSFTGSLSPLVDVTHFVSTLYLSLVYNYKFIYLGLKGIQVGTTVRTTIMGS